MVASRYYLDYRTMKLFQGCFGGEGAESATLEHLCRMLSDAQARETRESQDDKTQTETCRQNQEESGCNCVRWLVCVCVCCGLGDQSKRIAPASERRAQGLQNSYIFQPGPNSDGAHCRLTSGMLHSIAHYGMRYHGIASDRSNFDSLDATM